MRQVLEVRVEPKCGHSFSVLSLFLQPRLFEFVTETKRVWRKRLCSECHATKLFGRR